MPGGLNGPPILNGSAYAYPSKTLSELRDELLTMLGFPDPLTGADSRNKTLAELRERIITALGFADPLTGADSQVKTLAELQEQVITFLGFADPLTGIDSETKTLAELQDSIITALGFADPLTGIDSEIKTLVELRETVIRRCGFRYALGANPPGLDSLIDSFINEAQQTIFRTVEFDKGSTAFPALMVSDSDPTEIDYQPIYLLAVGLAKAHYGQPDSKAYFEQFSKYLEDRVKRYPPNIADQVTTWVNEAQQTIFRTVEFDKAGTAFPAVMTNPTDLTEIDYVPVYLLALGLAKSHYKQEDAKAYFEQFSKYLEDRVKRYPPNILDQVTAWINEAQQTIFRTVEFDEGGATFPAVMVGPTDATEIDYVPILSHATGLAKAHYDQKDFKMYFDQVTKYLADRVKRYPPNIQDQVDGWINEAQQFVFGLVELDLGGATFPAAMTGPTDSTEIDYVPVLSHAIGLAKFYYQQKDFKAYFDQVSKYVSDRAVRRPPKVVGMCTQWLIMAQRQLYHRYKMLRTELWWSIDLEVDERIYDVPYDADSALDFRYASECWIQDDDRWLPLRQGINPASFTITTNTIPTRFEFRQYFEVFPTPDKAYVAWIKGHRGLMDFAADDDVTTIDWEVILLQALVWGKAFFNQRDAAVVKQDLDIWIGQMNAGRFAGMRFVPRGTCPAPDAMAYPQVTFDRV